MSSVFRNKKRIYNFFRNQFYMNVAKRNFVSFFNRNEQEFEIFYSKRMNLSYLDTLCAWQKLNSDFILQSNLFDIVGGGIAGAAS